MQFRFTSVFFVSQVQQVHLFRDVAGVAKMADFTHLEDALSVWTNSGEHSLFVWLCVSSIKTSTRRIIRLDELSSVARLD